MKNKLDKNSDETSPKKTARIAGLLYLILAICAGVSWNYFNSLYVPGDALATVNNIQASGWLFRLHFVGNFAGQIAFLFLIYFLYKLLRPVNKDWARLMALLVVVSIPIAILNMLNLFAPILLLSGGYLSAFGTTSFNALIMLFLDLYTHGVFIAAIFWGLWLFPLGYLVFKSGFIPKTIGVFLIIAGLGYVIDSLLRFLMPGYNMELSSYTFYGELLLLLWLLIKGVDVEKWKKHAIESERTK
ncbi:MAG: DUF4386 domain-containing protein [Candidatus Omnitrophica bacterium]|nr:DUF4386 domain-containing protein [Candidatus Omnitrophota bacterium]